MSVYADTSVVLRLLLRAPGRLRDPGVLDGAYTSELLRIEGLRTLDRLRATGVLDDDGLAEQRSALLRLLDRLRIVAIDEGVKRRAADPYPTVLGTLEATHLATALRLRDAGIDLRTVATHDARLRNAAKALGFQVVG